MVAEKKLDRDKVEDILPLTSMQEEMLFRYIADPGSGQYFEQLCLELTADLDRAAAVKAWGSVMAANDALRSVFRWEKLEKPVRVVLNDLEPPVRFAELSGREDVALERLKAADRAAGIDIAREPFRVTFCILGENRAVLLLSSHHILFDGWSTAVMLKEFVEAYHAFHVGAKTELERVGTRHYLERYVKRDGRELDFWRAYLDGIEAKTPVIPQRRKTAGKTGGGKYTLEVPDDFTAKLHRFAGENRVTPAAVFYTAWGVLLQKYNRSRDVVFGTTVSGRGGGVSGIEKMVGLFINTVPLRVKSGPDSTLIGLLDAVKGDLKKRSGCENASLSEITASLGMSGQEGIFDSIVVVENFPLDREMSSYEDIAVGAYSMDELSNFDLTLAVDAFDRFKFNFLYHEDAFKKEDIERLSGHFMKVLNCFVESPQLELSKINILSDGEQRTVLESFNDSFSYYPREKTIGELFEEQAAAAPSQTAIVFEGKSVTYGELNARSNRLAWYLRGKGVGPDRIVGLMLERSVEMIVTVLAVLKAGGAYLPIDPAYPKERIAGILDDSGTELLLTARALAEDKSLEPAGQELIFLDELAPRLEGGDGGNLANLNRPSDLCYVMYTSGSTGKPKGSLTTHQNVIRIVKSSNYIKITPRDVMLQLSNYAFDGSTFDIFGSLLNGAKLVILKSEAIQNIYSLSKLIESERVTLFFVTTALFNTLVDINPEGLENVRAILFGGERVSVRHVKKALGALSRTKLIHVYGPTESTVFATYFPIDSVDESLGTVSIGRPVSNTRVYILDPDGNHMPVGVAGELCIAGEGLARGYLNRSELTSSRFVPNPYEPGRLMYKTGDLARWLADGNIEFLDRIDGQIKLRGFRIEPGEIEAQLLKHPLVKESVVELLEDARVGKFLCAYFVADSAVNGDELREFLKKELPAYMVPACFERLEVMPLNRNGKVDRKALPKPDFSSVDGGKYASPKGELEEKLQMIWQEVLGVEKPGATANFFELGGHSLKATALVSKIYKELGVELPLGSVFQCPTIRELAAFIASSSDSRSVFAPIPRAPDREYYVASSAQKRLFIQEQFEGIGVSYNMPLIFEAEGEIDAERLEAAVSGLVELHEALRTSFHLVDGEIVQKIHESAKLEIERLSCRNLQNAAAGFIRPFDLGTAPLMRVGLFAAPEGRCFLLLDMHHIVSDGISLNILLAQLGALYGGGLPEPPKVRYRDFSEWQAGLYGTAVYAKRREFWKKSLAGDLPELGLPTDFKRPEERSFEGGAVDITVPAHVADKLGAAARERGATLNMVLMSAYSILLAGHTGQEEFIIGSLAAGRTHPDLENVVGMFDNFLPIRTGVDYGRTALEQIGALKPFMLDAYENQDYPYEKMLEDCGVKAERSRNPLFDTMLILHNQFENAGEFRFGGLKLKRIEQTSVTSKLDLKLDVYQQTGGSLRCCFEYCARLFKKATVERLAVHYLNILRQIAQDPEKKLEEIELLSEAEKHQILSEFNDTRAPFPSEKTVCDLFEEQARRTPDKTAAVFGEDSLTFREFDEKSNCLASALRKNGVGRGSIVALLTERSLEMGVAVMAVLKAGGAYLPISPAYPPERVRYMLEDSGAKVLLVDGVAEGLSEAAASLAAGADGRRDIKLLNLREESLYDENADFESAAGPEDTAYVIYTSGSTGKPKGVLIGHRSLVNRLNWMQKKYPIGETDVILQKTTYTFDVSVWELLWWSMTGAGVCFLEPGGEKDPGVIVDAVEKYGVTTLHFVPSMLSVFLEYVGMAGAAGRLKSLRRVFASGEALSPKLAGTFGRLLGENGTTLHNLYGPTEATVDVSYFDCPKAEPDVVPIGRPIDNTNLYVVDKNSGLCPVGVPGELCIAGEGLARGYLNRPQLTAEKFVRNPFGKETGYPLMYKTGDLARWLADGNVEYLGRLDNQVKLRGFRIELGEIEAELLKHGRVKEAVVTARTDGAGNGCLCAYVVTDGETAAGELRERLKKTLPDYMIPAYFVNLPEMPLSQNGKTDRKALPEPEPGMSAETYEAPSDDVEKRLAEIWKELLNVPRVGVNDDFFGLGGHSLTATTLALRIKREFGADIPLGELFKNPVIKKLAPLVRRAERMTVPAIPQAEKRAYYPVSSAQKRIYLLNKIDSESTSYNLPAVMLVKGEVERGAFEKAFKKLIKRHEILRTSFGFVDGEPVQIVNENVEFGLEYKEAAGEDAKAMISEFIRPFDLGRAPLVRAEMVRLGPSRHLLLLDLHHIVADGMSMVVLVRDFLRLYKGRETEPLRIQYKDFAVWQNRLFASGAFKDEEAYWLTVFAKDVPALNLPTDYPRPSVQSFEGARVPAKIDGALLKNLKALDLRTGSTLYMLLLAAFFVLLHKYTGQNDIVVGSPMAGRPDAELEGLIGMFVNTVALRNFPENGEKFSDFLSRVRSSCLKAQENQQYQFEELVDRLELPRDISRNPLFDAMFVLQNTGLQKVEMEGLEFEPYPFERGVSKFDLTLEATENEDAAALNFEYCARLFKKATVERLAGHYLNILRQIAQDPEKKLEEIELLSEAEKHQILSEFNDTHAPFPSEKTICDLFEEQARRTPDRTAAVFGGDSLTYREFDEKSNCLASALRKNGVGRGSIVALLTERSLEMGVAVMAVLKAGGAYLPISPAYPPERVRYMLEDSGAKVLLVDGGDEGLSEAAASLAVWADGRRDIKLLNLREKSLYEGDADFESAAGPEDTAYVIYTSGSTGKPKGVLIGHRSLVNRLNWMQKKYPIGEKDVILQKTTYTFDVSVWELFWWSMTGAGVCFLEPGGEKDPGAIVDAVEKYGVTTLHFVPSMLSVFLEYVGMAGVAGRLKSLRRVFASGEALSPKLAGTFGRLLGENGTTLHNLYGPTEATVDVSYFDCPKAEPDAVPIGRPIDNTNLYVVDKNSGLCPVGVPGELCIAGEGLALGYLNRPQLTAEKFVRNPFGKETGYPLMYKTGDLARWLADGNVEYLGRLDNQVKLRGFRIELGEIEAELLKHERVKEAVVTARTDGAGNGCLCAYVVTDGEIAAGELRERLKKTLPDYMIPAYFVNLPEMPLSQNGKTDRKALPEPEFAANAETYEAPSDDVEKRLAEIWKEVLGRENVGTGDNFFDIGGNSLLLVRVHTRLNELYGGLLKVTDLFVYPTIAELAGFIRESGKSKVNGVKLKPVVLPAECFAKTAPSGYADLLEFRLGEELSRELCGLASEEAVEEADILIAAYSYMFAQVTKSYGVAVQLAFENDRLVELPLELEKAGNYRDLYRMVNRVRLAAAGVYRAGEAVGLASPDANLVFPCFCQSDAYRPGLEKTFGIVSELRSGGGGEVLSLEYDALRLSRTSAKSMMDMYIKIILLFVQTWKGGKGV